ncbi:MAG: hypothetical protein LBK00_00440 [Treponema sp.]|jgi:hypothetical protein|nr:hypothetical protein [Treponema sp.]
MNFERKSMIACFALLWCLAPLAAQDMQISGLFDSAVSLAAGAGEAEAFSYGIEEYANLRIRTGIGDYARFYSAFNLIAAAGSSLNTATAKSALNAATAPELSSSPYIAGDNYAAAMELERLYVQVNSDALDLVAGLMPLRFGYGQVFGPSDFLNPRNVLFPDARPRGIIGASAAFYPATAKLLAFAAAPKSLTETFAINSAGKGFRFGLSADNDWNWGSIQALYVFETPQSAAPDGRHQIGVSLKADVELGLVMDALYTYERTANNNAINGLSASVGFDYSLLSGDLYVLAEYLYNGASSITAYSATNPTGLFTKRHYAYAMCQYMFSDYTKASLSCMAGLEDASFLPAVSLYHELFQGMSLTFSTQFPLAIDDNGEFAPQTMGQHFSFTTKASFRF